MTYKENLHNKMLELSKDPLVRFLGYNTKYGHQFNGTLKGCEESCIELPVAENLIMGLAIGMALEGYTPIVCIERMNFLWTCADAIINHLGKARELGWGQLDVVIRTCICGNAPLDPGCQHQGDDSDVWRRYIRVEHSWALAYPGHGPVMIIEDRRDYESDRSA